MAQPVLMAPVLGLDGDGLLSGAARLVDFERAHQQERERGVGFGQFAVERNGAARVLDAGAQRREVGRAHGSRHLVGDELRVGEPGVGARA